MATEYIALIPAYKPCSRMLEMVRDMRQRGFEIVIVDDGSGESYEDIFHSAEEYATILMHKVNQGKGAALKTGLEYIYRYIKSGGMAPGNAVIVTVDADGQHLAKDAYKIAMKAASRPGELVMGSRALCENVPLRSRLGNTITRHVFNLSTGASLHDTQTGLRAFSADLIPMLLAIDGERYEYEINMLLTFAKEGIPIIEEEIETVYIDGNSGSHFNTFRDSVRVYKEIIKFSAASFTGFLVDYAMYAILLAAGLGIVPANICARAVSSVTNFTINRKLVFRSSKGLMKSAVQYFALAAFILVGNTIVLSVLTGTVGIGRFTAKIITEVLFFMLSWLVQKYVIFYSDTEVSGRPEAVRVRARRPGRLVNAHVRKGDAA